MSNKEHSAEATDVQTQFSSHASHDVLPNSVSEIKTFMNTLLRVTDRAVCSCLFISLFSVCIPNNKTAYLHAILRGITVPYKRTYARFKYPV
jgi:hypothetical protein